MTAAWTPRRQAMSHDRVHESIESARRAVEQLSATGSNPADALHAIAGALRERRVELQEANDLDVRAARHTGLATGLVERLRMTDRRIGELADDVQALAEQPDALGGPGPEQAGCGQQVVRVPLGVLGAVYEAQPTATVLLACLAVKAGNGVLLRGGAEAANTDGLLVELIRGGLDKAGLPAELVQPLPVSERSTVRYLVSAHGLVDLVVLRGGPRLIRAARADATVPILELGSGGCHIYLDAAADLQVAEEVVRASLSSAAGPDAVRTVLVHTDIAATIAPVLGALCVAAGVPVHGDARLADLLPGVRLVDADHWQADQVNGDVALATTTSVAEAVAHVNRYSGGHTEAIVTNDRDAARAFAAQVDAAAIHVNAPTRAAGPAALFATQKVLARGALRAEQLTTTKLITWRNPA